MAFLNILCLNEIVQNNHIKSKLMQTFLIL